MVDPERYIEENSVIRVTTRLEPKTCTTNQTNELAKDVKFSNYLSNTRMMILKQNFVNIFDNARDPERARSLTISRASLRTLYHSKACVFHDLNYRKTFPVFIWILQTKFDWKHKF